VPHRYVQEQHDRHKQSQRFEKLEVEHCSGGNHKRAFIIASLVSATLTNSRAVLGQVTGAGFESAADGVKASVEAADTVIAIRQNRHGPRVSRLGHNDFARAVPADHGHFSCLALLQ
jgi:hypothetical protein